MGRRIWVIIPDGERPRLDGGKWQQPGFVFSCRVLSLQAFLPADGHRKKHLVKLWTDPGGTRVLSVGSICLKDPGRSAGAKERAERERKRQDNLAAAEEATWD